MSNFGPDRSGLTLVGSETRPRPAAVSPGHPDLAVRRPRAERLADAGRRLELVVALEARRAEVRSRRER